VRARVGLSAVLCWVLLAAPAVAGGPETHLENGFPRYTYNNPGTYAGGEMVNVLLGDVDEDPDQEIFISGTAGGPLFGWKGDGSALPGWPVRDLDGFAYAGMGDLSSDSPALDLAVGNWSGGVTGPRVSAYGVDGRTLPGWPISTFGSVTSAPALADVDGDALDEIFVRDGEGDLSAYGHDGKMLPGWPVHTFTLYDVAAPAIADLDADGDLEIVASADGWVYAWNVDGTELDGYPVRVTEQTNVRAYPVVGDVDGDGELEIVVVSRESQAPWRALVAVLSTSGTTERIIEVPAAVNYGAAPALADLAGDPAPEIVLHAGDQVHVWHGDGTAAAGWPAYAGVRPTGVSPVVGDVDGDRRPDVVTLTASTWEQPTELRVFSSDGELKPGFPWTLPVWNPIMPAIGDIDGDARNEIVVAGDAHHYIGYAPGVLAYDLGGEAHGEIEWGQFAGGPRHQGRYRGEHDSRPLPEPAGATEGPAYRIGDLAAGPASSAPRDPEPFLGRLFFQADDGRSGEELWASAGSPANTRRVADIRPGPAGARPHDLTRVGDTLFFVADDGATGAELWKTDGTPGGTVRVRDIWPGPKGSTPMNLVAAGDTLFFTAWDGEHGYELWRSDGSSSNTMMVEDMLVGSGATDNGAGAGSDPMDLTVFGGDLYFRAFTTAWEGKYGVWRLRAGESLPEPVAPMTPVKHPWEPAQLVGSAGRLWVSAGDDVLLLDGDALQTYVRSDLEPLSRFFPFRDGILYAAAERAGHFRPMAWHLPGPGASPLDLGRALRPAGLGMTSGYIAEVDGKALISATDGNSGIELWETEGTVESTSLLGDLRPGPAGSAPALMTDTGGGVLFTADDGQTGRELWRSDGSQAGTARLQDVAPGPRGSHITWIARVGDHVYFSADDGTHGQELWAISSSGTPPDETDPIPPLEPEDPQPGGPGGGAAGGGGAQDAGGPAGGNAPPGGSAPVGDRTAPLIRDLRLRPRSFAAGRSRAGMRIVASVSEGCVLRFRISRLGRAHPLGGFARSATSGTFRGRFKGIVRDRRLRPGSYVLRVVAEDPAGNRGKTVRRAFTIRR
jgi:ELWxxDGT repeat protein